MPSGKGWSKVGSVPAGIARPRPERRMRLAAHQPVHELAAGGMAEQVHVLAIGDLGGDQVAHHAAHQRVGPAVDVARIAAGREHAAIVVAFDAGPDLVGEGQRHDQQLVLVGGRHPEVAVFVAVAQHAVLHDHDRAVGRVAIGAVGLQLERTVGVAVVVDGMALRPAWPSSMAMRSTLVSSAGFMATCQAVASFRWQADQWPGEISFRTGACSRQRGMACGQRGLNVQPGGGFSGDGISP